VGKKVKWQEFITFSLGMHFSCEIYSGTLHVCQGILNFLCHLPLSKSGETYGPLLRNMYLNA